MEVYGNNFKQTAEFQNLCRRFEFEAVTTRKFRGRFAERIKSRSQNVHYSIIVEEISIRYSLKNRIARYFFCEFGKSGVSSAISLQ